MTAHEAPAIVQHRIASLIPQALALWRLDRAVNLGAGSGGREGGWHAWRQAPRVNDDSCAAKVEFWEIVSRHLPRGFGLARIVVTWALIKGMSLPGAKEPDNKLQKRKRGPDIRSGSTRSELACAGECQCSCL